MRWAIHPVCVEQGQEQDEYEANLHHLCASSLLYLYVLRWRRRPAAPPPHIDVEGDHPSRLSVESLLRQMEHAGDELALVWQSYAQCLCAFLPELLSVRIHECLLFPLNPPPPAQLYTHNTLVPPAVYAGSSFDAKIFNRVPIFIPIYKPVLLHNVGFEALVLFLMVGIEFIGVSESLLLLTLMVRCAVLFVLWFSRGAPLPTNRIPFQCHKCGTIQ